MSFTSGFRKNQPANRSTKTTATTLSVKDRALGLLAWREHSSVELKRKLQQKGYVPADIEAELSQLQQDGSLSDRRFTEAYVNMRMNRGYGPMRIQAELRDKGIAAELANEYLQHELLDWQAVLRRQYTKKYAGAPITDHQDKSKRIAYLQARGFRLDLIFDVINQS